MNQASIKSSAGRLIRLPFYLLQIFTCAKSFRDNPVIGSKLLNVLGLHVARVVFAALMTNIRYLFLAPLMDKTERESFRQNGYLLIENYLPQENFNALNAEVRAMSDVQVRQCVQGDTLTQRVLLDEAVVDSLPVCNELVNNSEFLDRLKYTSARNNSPIFYVQRIKSNARDAEPDPQRLLHSDTFHSTMKAWLFLDEVGDHNGAFTYVPGSHKLSLQRLKWEYSMSIEGCSQANSYGSRGSLRVTDDELASMGMGKPAVFNVPANTLVIADTHGFHRRGAASEVSSRLEIWAYSRTNPFNPLVGFNLQWYKKLTHLVIHRYLERQDKIAEAKGRPASWHLIDSSEMFESVKESGELHSPELVTPESDTSLPDISGLDTSVPDSSETEPPRPDSGKVESDQTEVA